MVLYEMTVFPELRIQIHLRYQAHKEGGILQSKRGCSFRTVGPIRAKIMEIEFSGYILLTSVYDNGTVATGKRI
jgi:hypothetical protein